MTRYRKALIVTLALVLLATGPWMWFHFAAIGEIHGPETAPDHTDVALVLGAKIHEDGRPTVSVRERVELAAQLYFDGHVDALLMSGDGRSSTGQDEPAVMRELAINLGVPSEAIVMDETGVDTYASCQSAARRFDIESITVVSQEYHVPRAMWLCSSLGMRTEGSYPPPLKNFSRTKSNLREFPADWKAVIEVAQGRPMDADDRSGEIDAAIAWTRAHR